MKNPRSAAKTMQVRLATHEDHTELVALENATFRHDRISARQYRHHLAKHPTGILVAEQHGMILASAVLFFRKDSTAARLYSIAVAKQARGLGLGKRLLEAAMHLAKSRRMREMRLEVKASNKAAIQLYERTGFSFMRQIPKYYEDGATALRYRKDLTPNGPKHRGS